MASEGFHRQQVDLRCRICGRKRDKGRTHKTVSDLAFELMSVFGVDVRADLVDRHPTRLCSRCWRHVQRSTSAGPSDHVPETVLVPVSNWPECGGESCGLCSQWKIENRGGVRKKLPCKRGRPPGASGGNKETSKGNEAGPATSDCTVPLPEHPDFSARLESLVFDRPLFVERFVGTVSENFICPVCKEVVDKPMAVPVPGCDHACCYNCWTEWLPHSATCPVCRETVNTKNLQPLPRPLWQQLQSLQVHCDYWSLGCPVVVDLVQLRDHAGSCHYKHHPDQPAGAEGHQPAPDQPRLSLAENRLLADLLRRLCLEHQSLVGLPVLTGGRPLHISFTPSASSGDVSERTQRRRQQTMLAIEKSMCGGNKQLSSSVSSISPTRLKLSESNSWCLRTSTTQSVLLILWPWQYICVYQMTSCGSSECGQKSGICSWHPNAKRVLLPVSRWVTWK